MLSYFRHNTGFSIIYEEILLKKGVCMLSWVKISTFQIVKAAPFCNFRIEDFIFRRSRCQKWVAGTILRRSTWYLNFLSGVWTHRTAGGKTIGVFPPCDPPKFLASFKHLWARSRGPSFFLFFLSFAHLKSACSGGPQSSIEIELLLAIRWLLD